MKRIAIAAVLLVAAALAGCVTTWDETYTGPSAKATCPPTAGVPITKDGWVFVPIGTGWYDTFGNRHPDTVYIIQGLAQGEGK